MLPAYPIFSSLSLLHKQTIEEFTAQFDPYSDHNFTSLFGYNTDNSFLISTLNNNLIIFMKDYVQNQKFYTFIGNNEIENTIEMLLLHSKNELKHPSIRLIPEFILNKLNKERLPNYQIVEERDSFDYILSIEDMIHLKGDVHHARRNEIAQFTKLFPDYSLVHLSLSDFYTQQSILTLFDTWKQNQNKTEMESRNERNAIERVLTHANELSVKGFGITVQSTLIGFCLYECLPNNHIMAHYAKSNYTFKGINSFLFHSLAKYTHQLGYTHWNHQQDLGIITMRHSKESWNPVKYLKKYTIIQYDVD